MAVLLDGHDEAASAGLRDAGHQRAYDLLKLNTDKVERIVSALMAHPKIEHGTICELLR